MQQGTAFAAVRVETSQLVTLSGVYPLVNISSAQLVRLPSPNEGKAHGFRIVGVILAGAGLGTWGLVGSAGETILYIEMVAVGIILIVVGTFLGRKTISSVLVSMTGGEAVNVTFQSESDAAAFLTTLSAAISAARPPTHIDARQVHIHNPPNQLNQ